MHFLRKAPWRSGAIALALAAGALAPDATAQNCPIQLLAPRHFGGLAAYDADGTPLGPDLIGGHVSALEPLTNSTYLLAFSEPGGTRFATFDIASADTAHVSYVAGAHVTGIATDGEGTAFFVVPQWGAFLRLDVASGEVTEITNKGMNYPTDLLWDTNGSGFWVASSRMTGLSHVTFDGRVTNHLGRRGLQYPHSVERAEDGRIVIGHQHGLWLWDPRTDEVEAHNLAPRGQAYAALPLGNDRYLAATWSAGGVIYDAATQTATPLSADWSASHRIAYVACGSDDDGIPDPFDSCPADDNHTQSDLDGDGVGDACDDDRDGDGIANADDACPEDYNEVAVTAGRFAATEVVALGEATGFSIEVDPTGVAPFTIRVAAADTALFTLLPGGTVVDAHTRDFTGVDFADAGTLPVLRHVADAPSPFTFMTDATIAVELRVTDATGCEALAPQRFPVALVWLDADADGHPDQRDNCPAVANPTQADLDGDNVGDPCDDDVDGDGIANAQDPCPRRHADDPMAAGALAPVDTAEAAEPFPLRLLEAPDGEGPYEYAFELVGAARGAFFGAPATNGMVYVPGVDPADASTHPRFSPGALVADGIGAQVTEYLVHVRDATGCPAAEPLRLPITVTPTAVSSAGDVRGARARLHAAPNPTDGRLAVEYALDGPADLRVFDELGRTVYAERLTSARGRHDVDLRPYATAAGVYVLSLRSARETLVTRVVLRR